jgi:hypothetical protein
MTLTDLWSGNDDTDCDYYDTPSGNIWCPDGGEPTQQAPGQEPSLQPAAPARTTTTMAA